MTNQPRQNLRSLLSLTKALADENRLRITALLARRPHYGEELAEFLQLSAATVSHHLRLLREADLVETRRESPYVLYRLRSEGVELLQWELEHLADLAARLGIASDEELASDLLRSLLDEDGRLRKIPSQRRARSVALRWAAHHLETGRLYPERELRRILLELFDEPDRLRNALIQIGWLQRSGVVYRRIEEVERT